jgi:hypothetical protein
MAADYYMRTKQDPKLSAEQNKANALAFAKVLAAASGIHCLQQIHRGTDQDGAKKSNHKGMADHCETLEPQGSPRERRAESHDDAIASVKRSLGPSEASKRRNPTAGLVKSYSHPYRRRDGKPNEFLQHL